MRIQRFQEELKAQVRTLEILSKNVRQELDKAKAELRDLPDARRKAAALAAALANEEELKQRVERMDTKLASALAMEAALRRERDGLLDWKVGLELGLPELVGPSQVIRGEMRASLSLSLSLSLCVCVCVCVCSCVPT